MNPLLKPSSSGHGVIRKRVGKACDRCRLKKSKCDGSRPCNRCEAENNICVFDGRKKSLNQVYSKAYVEMLENQQSQLIDALQEMYRCMQNGHGCIGPPVQKSSHGISFTNEILEHLRLIKQEDHSTCQSFQDDPNLQNSEHIACGIAMVEKEIPEGRTYRATPSAYELLPPKTEFSNSIHTSNFPPTPDESPPPNCIKKAPQNEAHPHHQVATQSQSAWSTPTPEFATGTDFISQYDLPKVGNLTGFTSFANQIDYEQTIPSVIYPILANGESICVMVTPKALSSEWQSESFDYTDDGLQ